MNTLFINAKILSMKDENITYGNVFIKDHKIAYIGEDFPLEQIDEVIDCKGNLLMPSFKNAHTHSAMSFLKGYANNLSLEDWLFKRIIPLEEKLIPGDVKWLAKISLLDYISGGVSACYDMYYYAPELVESSIQYGFRTVVALINHTCFKEKDFKTYFAHLNSQNELISYILSFHSVYTVPKEELKLIAEVANEAKIPVYAHLSETQNEVDNCYKEHGLSPVEYCDSLGLFNYGGGGFHLVHTSDKDREIMKKRGLYVVSCPGSNIKLASGIAPLKKYYQKEIVVALGTDGPASNDNLDMFYEMRLAASLENTMDHNPIGIPPFEILKMATVNAAHAMGLFDADYLEVGKLADIIMINLEAPNLEPHEHIISDLVYSGAKSNVKLTMINGRIVYHNGKYYVNESPKVVYKKCREIYNRIVGK